jgi:uncharacterized protein YacL
LCHGGVNAVLNNIIKFSFAIVGAVTGFTLTKTVVVLKDIELLAEFEIAIYCVVSIGCAYLFYSTGNKIIDSLVRGIDKMETFIQNMTLYELTVSSIGLIAGLIIANLITIPINRIDIIGVPISIIANVFFGCLGIGIALGKKNEVLFDSLRGRHSDNSRARLSAGFKILDTSVIIDGRIADIIRSGFIEGELILPGFVLEELRHIADSADVLKRNKGRRGLDILNIIQKELDYPVRIENTQLPGGAEVDTELIKLAKKLGGMVMTTDYNLNKVASLQEVPVLNVNELANAVKPIALPGEEMVVQVIKDGKENGQGIGYMEDGTMIVVDGGKRHMGESVNVMVTSILQTAAGRMIFARPKCTIERVI